MTPQVQEESVQGEPAEKHGRGVEPTVATTASTESGHTGQWRVWTAGSGNEGLEGPLPVC